jgi:hypothetical protein
MKQKVRASLSIPVTLKSLLKQAAARKNLFLSEYISLILLRDLEEQAGHPLGEVPQPSRADQHQTDLAFAGSKSQEVHE